MIIDAAKSTRIEDEVARRGIKLIGRGERVGPCPVCGGRDRFSINLTKQVWNCRGCSKGGDVVDLVKHLDNCDFQTAVQTLGGDERKPVALVKKPTEHEHNKESESDQEKTERALKIWAEASEVNGTLAEQYLRRRGLKLPDDDHALRFYSPCPFGDTRYPALIALFRSIVTNEPKAIHRIALGPGGILIAKRMLGRVGGCAVKLDPDDLVEHGLAVGEGIETMIAARMRGFRPAWALGSAGAIRQFPVLAGIDALTILVDNDPPDHNGRRAGPEAAAECSARWSAAGREVRRVLPRRQGADMADDLCGGPA
ncbi:putative DNA primase/helicase [Bradyrhizobium erythrophlei]|nr:putative DNA primase/helicase [Bradyrhizobium erythrophlei]